ncbi:MAG: DPP IV N-terminal domain-containing protein [Anaerolineae bacterium]|nr:DPP IV N-terminal domain-containing protein [Anaerolineae bacterium]
MKWLGGVWLGLAIFLLVGCQLGPVAAELPVRESRIAFMSNRDGNFEIYVMDRTGENLTKLTDGTAAHKLLPAWSDGANAYGYLEDRGGAGLVMLRMDGFGENVQPLNTDLAIDPSPLSWSPDGAWIGFGAGRENNAEVYVVDALGETVINLSNHPAEDLFGDWSPDGKQVVFVSDRDGPPVIYLADLEGSELMQITSPEVGSGRPAWSPDGRHIAYMTNQDGGDIEIYTIHTETGEMARLTENPGFDGFPHWSPDGSKIAFLTDRDGNAEIYVMNADGSEQINITNLPNSNESVQGDFSWSPDGGQILFQSVENQNVEVFVMNADGSEQINLTNDPAIDIASVWVR